MKFILLRESHDLLQHEFSFLRKEPKYLKLFKKFREEEKKDMKDLEDLYDKIKSHRNTLKQNNIDIVNQAKSYQNALEILNKAEVIEKFNKFVKLLPSTLRNEVKKSERFKKDFKKVINGFDYEDYKNNFLKKVAKYKDPYDLFLAAENYLKAARPKLKLLEELKANSQAKIWYVDENTVIAMIFSQEASCKFGSQNWCIAGSSGDSWETYIDTDPPGVQYFVWDFTKKSTDNSSLIGITMYTKDKNNRKTGGWDADFVDEDDFDEEDDLGEFEDEDESIGRGNIANNKSDSPIDITGRHWYGLLKIFSELDKEDQQMYIMHNQGMMNKINLDLFGDEFKKKYFLENPLNAGRNFDNIDFLSDEEVQEVLDKHPKLVKHPMFFNRIDTETKTKYQRQYFIEGNYTTDPKALVDEFSDLDFLEQEDVDKMVEEHPELLTIEMFYRRVSKEKVKEVVIGSPQKAYKFKTDFLNEVIESPKDYTDMVINLLRNYRNEGGFNYERQFKDYWNKFPKLKFYYDKDFIKNLFESNIELCLKFIPDKISELSLEEINNLFKNNVEDWAAAFKQKGRIHTPMFNQIVNYFKKGSWRKFEKNEFYVFNAEDSRFFSNENQFTLIQCVKFHPFRNSNIVSVLKTRSALRKNLTTYGIWVTKGLFNGDDSFTKHDIEKYGNSENLMNLIKRKKIKL